MIIEGPYMNVGDTMNYLGGMPRSTLRQLTKERKFLTSKVGKRVLYIKSDIDAYVAANLRMTHEQLEEEVSQKRQELNLPASGTANHGKGARS